MAYLGDYHTHTIYSKRKWLPYKHGKNTVAENVERASELGLKEIAITDHGFGHRTYATNINNILSINAQKQALEEKYKINVLTGVEANIISLQGDIDITLDEIKSLDILVCGFHTMAKGKTIKDRWLMFTCNFFAKLFHVRSQKNIQRNTDAYIKMLNKYPVDIISHINHGIAKVDAVRVAEEAVKTNTYVELNCKRINFTRNEIDEMVKMGVMFIVDSDAHSVDRIADFNLARKFIKEYNIPEKNVANLNKLPTFKNYKRK